MTFLTVDEEAAIKLLDENLSPKQQKVVNFFVGQVIAKHKREKLPGYPDPKLVRQLVIAKLSILTYEGEE